MREKQVRVKSGEVRVKIHELVHRTLLLRNSNTSWQNSRDIPLIYSHFQLSCISISSTQYLIIDWYDSHAVNDLRNPIENVVVSSLYRDSEMGDYHGTSSPYMS